MSIRKFCGFQRLCQAKAVVQRNQIEQKAAFARSRSFQIGPAYYDRPLTNAAGRRQCRPYQNAHSAVEFNSVPSRTLRMDNLMPGFPFLASSLDAKVERNKARGGAAYCENPISQGIVMKARRSTQSKIARSNSDASLARSYFDLQRLRDEIRRAEAGCSLRRSKERPPRKHLAGWYHLT